MTAVAKRALGQHFLADPNILGVAGRLAELEEHDVVLEIGPGLGILTTFLADRVAFVHAVEVDRELEPRLAETIGARGNIRLVFGDALRIDLAALAPTPRKLVANLPYNIATPLVAESITSLPSIDLWCVMLQREVADRFFAVPGSKAYGAVSVLVQLAAARTGFHPVARTVFRPQPNVDSALLAFRRVTLPADFPRIKCIVEGAFSHRRKTLANALQLSAVAEREQTYAALAAIDRPADSRAEALEPAEFVALAAALR